MKKITFNINGAYDGKNSAKKIQEAINSLSGVVSAEVFPRENKAYAYAGEKLDAVVITEAAGRAGFSLSVAGEECLTGISDVKNG